LQDWERFHAYFLSEMSYIRRPLPDIIARFCGGEEFQKLLKEYTERHTAEKRKFLTGEENDFLSEYFSFIGKSDYAGQRDYFTSVTTKIKNFTEKGQKDGEKYTDLYVKLGFLLGLAIVIFLV
jgi:stage III sporulation protein AB